jgi:transcriptional regulator GlxA family with amidase domain
MRLEAARSLILRGLKLEVVAAQTGFCDAYHLSKAFRQRFAVAPATYRRKLKA